jgi:hypothetical protein
MRPPLAASSLVWQCGHSMPSDNASTSPAGTAFPHLGQAGFAKDHLVKGKRTKNIAQIHLERKRIKRAVVGHFPICPFAKTWRREIYPPADSSGGEFVVTAQVELYDTRAGHPNRHSPWRILD